MDDEEVRARGYRDQQRRRAVFERTMQVRLRGRTEAARQLLANWLPVRRDELSYRKPEDV